MSRDFQQTHWDLATEDDCRQLIHLAAREDLGRTYDWTTVALVAPETVGSADLVARRAGVVAGLPAAQLVLAEMDSRLSWQPCAIDGANVAAGQILATVAGPARSLLTAERPLLNFLGHLSGIATLTWRYVQAVADTGARVYDTRKTTPGWRRLEKYAVRMGGGHNHRSGLFDAVLIKDNHLALGASRPESNQATVDPAAGEPLRSKATHYSPAQAVTLARHFLARLPATEPASDMIIEVEVDNLIQFAEVLTVRPDIVLLDNMSLQDLRTAVAQRNAQAPEIELEASGGVNLETIRDIASTGIDRISVGALTHSASWFDVGLDWTNAES